MLKSGWQKKPGSGRRSGRLAATVLYAGMTVPLSAGMARAQQGKTPSAATLPDAPVADADSPAMFRHPSSQRWLVQGQANIIFQAHAPFHSPYDGVNSLQGRGEYKTSLVGTLYLGVQVHRHARFATDLIVDVESAGGRGISQALGLAGFTNLDVVRNPTLGSKPYLARYELHQVIGLSKEMVAVDRTPFSLATELPARRLDLHLGKMSLPDFLDVNAVGSDSHLQFLNWTADNNGAWDYAADTRGYTDALVAEYVDHAFTARYALAAMPTVANGIDLGHSFDTSGQNFELEVRRGGGGHRTTARLLGFVNQANMGVYRDQVVLARVRGTTPDITDHARRRTVKYGVGGNLEQALGPNLRGYARFGWNEGQHESYAYTEVDQTVAVGADYSGRGYGRPFDQLGATYISNAIKKDHQNYLAAGGAGFLLGDGRLNYGREDILESYYNVHAWKGVYYALDAQFVEHPGYNRDRGPVLVESVRMHVDF